MSKDIQNIRKNLDELKTHIKKISLITQKSDAFLIEIKRSTRPINKYSTEISHISSDLLHLHESLSVLKVFPPSEEAATAIETIESPIQEAVNESLTVINNLSSEISKATNKISNYETLMQEINGILHNISTGIGSIEIFLQALDKVFNAFPKQENNIIAQVEHKIAIQLNTNLTDLNKLLNSIEIAINQLIMTEESINTEISNLESINISPPSWIQSISSAIGAFSSALKQNISIPYMVKIKIRNWSDCCQPWKWEWSPMEATFSVESILKGISGVPVISQLESAANKILGNVTKPISNLSKSIAEPAFVKDIVNTAKKLEEELTNLQSELDTIFNIASPENIKSDIDEFNKTLTLLDLKPLTNLFCTMLGIKSKPDIELEYSAVNTTNSSESEIAI